MSRLVKTLKHLKKVQRATDDKLHHLENMSALEAKSRHKLKKRIKRLIEKLEERAKKLGLLEG